MRINKFVRLEYVREELRIVNSRIYHAKRVKKLLKLQEYKLKSELRKEDNN